MPIQVTCPGCHKRFKVSERYAGKEGPCPKCKATIRIPSASDEVVVHEPEHSELGATDTKGQSVLKPISRIEVAFHPVAAAGIVGSVLVVFFVALLIGRSGSPSGWVLGLGAVLLGPPLAWAGYTFLRDDGLEPYTGRSLWIRTAICSLLYAALWGVFTYVNSLFFAGEPLAMWKILFLAPPFLFLGAGIAYVCYDLDMGNGFFHYSLYLLATILLRMVAGLNPL